MRTSLFKIVGIALAFMLGAFVGSLTGDPVVTMAAGSGVSLVHMVHVGIVQIPSFTLPTGVLASSIDISALATALGAYHREHRDELVAEILLDEDFTSDMEVMDDITDELPLPSLALDDLIKPANATTFAPTANAIDFNARTLKVRGVKVDLQLIPSVLEKTWLGKMKKANDPLDMPFEAFIMNYINSKIKENLRLKAIYKGVYNAAGVTPADTMDGYLKLIADAITATTIAPIVTGAITSANVVDKLELVYDGLGDAYKGVPTIMKVNSQIFDWYNRKYRLDFGGNQDYKGMQRLRRPLDGTLCELVREPGLGTSQRTICSVKENFVYGVDSANGYTLDVQKFDRTLKILIDFKAGVNFKEIHARALAVNDQV
jgi:hypothetical protein